MYGNHMSAGGWVFSIFVTLIVLGLIVAGILWLASNRTRHDSDPEGAASPREILERSLASGEITAGQYDEVRTRLVSSSFSDPGPRKEP